MAGESSTQQAAGCPYPPTCATQGPKTAASSTRLPDTRAALGTGGSAAAPWRTRAQTGAPRRPRGAAGWPAHACAAAGCHGTQPPRRRRVVSCAAAAGRHGQACWARGATPQPNPKQSRQHAQATGEAGRQRMQQGGHLHGLLASTAFGTASSSGAATATGSPGRGRLPPGPRSPGPGTSAN